MLRFVIPTSLGIKETDYLPFIPFAMKSMKYLMLAVFGLAASAADAQYLSIYESPYNPFDMPNCFALGPRGNVYVATDDGTTYIHNIPTTASSWTGWSQAGRYTIYSLFTYSTGYPGVTFGGDGGPATAAGLSGITGMAADRNGNLYVTDYVNVRIRKIDSNGIITTFAGGSSLASTAEGIPATAAFVNQPTAVGCDKWGNVYIAQGGDNKVRKVDTNGIIRTVAGNGIAGYTGDGGPATNANITLAWGTGMAVDSVGNIYLAGTRVRKVGTDGTISCIAGTGFPGYSGDGGPATAASISAGYIAVDGSGNLFLSGYNGSGAAIVRRVDPSGIITTVAGGGSLYPMSASVVVPPITYTTYTTPATATFMGQSGGLQTDAAGNLYYLDIGGMMSLYQIRFDLAPQTYEGNGQTVTICENGSAYNLDSTLSVYDNSGAPVHWSVATAPTHGSFVGSFTAGAASTLLIPSGISYTPNVGFSGTDFAVVAISNGTATNYDTIHFVINANTTPAIVGDSVMCADGRAHTYFTATPASGGWWSVTGAYSYETISDTFTAVATSVGTRLLQYTDGCATTIKTLTMLPVPVIHGNSNVCVGDTIELSDSVAGGAWSVSGSHASISSAGVVTGISDGFDTVTYVALGGCTATKTMDVGLPVHFSADTGVCSGTSMALPTGWISESWVSSNIDVISISSGNLYFDNAGTSIVTASNACGSRSTNITVYQSPDPITGISAQVCEDATGLVSDDVPGGIFSSASPNVFVEDYGGFYVDYAYYGSGIGLGEIDYIMPGGCTAAITFDIIPAVVPLVCDSVVCADGVLYVSLADSGSIDWSGGSFGCSDSSATVIYYTYLFGGEFPDGVYVSNLPAGPVTLTYDNGCGTSTRTVTVNPVPDVPAVTPSICSGSTITATDATGGGTWGTSYGNLSVTSGGVVSAVHGSWDNVVYTLPTGCYNSAPVYISTVPPAPIMGNGTFCDGEHLNLVDSIPGGFWTSGNLAVVNNEMVAVAAGTATITYNNGCGQVTKTVTVYPSPAPIYGHDTVCVSATALYTDTSTGGVWSVSGSGSISTGGLFTPTAPGWVLVNFTLPTGCVYRKTVEVDLPGASTLHYTDDSVFCGLGWHTGLTDSATGGTWTSSNTDVANLAPVTYGVSFYSSAPGIATITYSLTNACGSFAPYKTVTVYPAPDTTIFHHAPICVGASYSVSEADSTGIWHNFSDVASLSAWSGLSRTITGVTPGVDTITYTDNNVCGLSTLLYITPVLGAPVVAPIMGDSVLCVGATALYSDSTWGGYFSGAGYGGLFTATTAGAFAITYTVDGACGNTVVTKAIAVYPLSGTSFDSTEMCEGTTITLSGIIPGGTWTNYNGHATITGTWGETASVDLLTPARDTVSYTVTSFCGTATSNHILLIDVYLPDNPITGDSVLCIGDSVNLIGEPLAGVWSSTVPAIANVNGNGTVFGLSAGRATISFTDANACGTVTETKAVTINPTAFSAVVDSVTICIGTTTFITSPLPGGAWTVFNGDAVVGSPVDSGTAVYGGTAGTDTVYFSLTTFCGTAVYKHIIHILNVPTGGTIVGDSVVCAGSTLTLTDTAVGGTWSSGTPGVAAIASTGIVTAVSAGTTIISYTISNICGSVHAMKPITVYPTSGAPSLDSFTVCVGATHSFTPPVGGGTWSTALGLVSLSGTTGPVTATCGTVGTDTVYYTVSTTCGTKVYKHLFKVFNEPTAGTITGSSVLCVGSAATLTETGSGGVWASGTPGVAAITTTGIVTAVSPGTTTVFYSQSNACGTASATWPLTVYPVPAMLLVDSFTLCVGGTQSFTPPVGGGTWSTAFGVVSLSASTGPITVSCSTVGTDTVFYTLTTTCGAVIYKHLFHVVAAPTAGAISGSLSVCTGSVGLLTDDGTPGGSWSVSGSAATFFGSGIIGGVSPGTATVVYLVGNLCGSASTSAVVTVNPAASSSIDSTSLCPGAMATYTASPPGGTWTMSNGYAVFATWGGATQMVDAVSAGRDTAIYTYSSVCGTAQQIHIIKVETDPVLGPITGDSVLCAGQTITLSNATAGGTWGSYNAAVVTTSGSLVTGVATGTTQIYYRVVGCTSQVVTKTVNVSSGITFVVDTVEVCVGTVTTLSDDVSGGTWSISNASATEVPISGHVAVTGVSVGLDTLIYTPASGCIAHYWHEVRIGADTTLAPIGGASTVCKGATLTLADAQSGGTWTSSNPSVVAIGATTGVLTGLMYGAATITYSAPGMCGVVITATQTIAVDTLPVVAVTGPDSLCSGADATFTGLPLGGTWSGGTSGIGTIAGGTLAGIAPGSVVITYSLANVCGTAQDTHAVVVDPSGNVMVDTVQLCVGTSTTVNDDVSGGTWSASNARVSTSLTTGGVVLTGAAPGYDSLTYTPPSGCITGYLHKVWVHADTALAAIGGGSAVCRGTTLTLTDAQSGGTWTSSNTSLATVNSGGVVSGVAYGTVTISYSGIGMCGLAIMATKTVSVDTLPNATISGLDSLCNGATLLLTASPIGGSWGSSVPAVATVGGGYVTGVSAGTTQINYTVVNACGFSIATKDVTVNPSGTITSDSTHLCVGASTTLMATTGGGAWIVNNGHLSADTVSGGLLVTGVSAGRDTAVYTAASVCPLAYRHLVTVIADTGLTAITGDSVLCAGTSTTLTEGVMGGTWMSSMPTVAAVTSGGVVAASTAGTTTIGFQRTNACGILHTATKTVTVQVAPTLTLAGADTLCPGSSATYTVTGTGGSWSLADALAVGVVDSAGCYRVTAVNAGADTVRYMFANACGIILGVKAVYIAPLPMAGMLTGADTLCPGMTDSCFDSQSGGVWAVADGSLSVSGTGKITYLTSGTDTVLYTTTTYCGSQTDRHAVYCATLPVVAYINGDTSVCAGATIALTDTATGGDWFRTNGNINFVPTGNSIAVTGVSAGMDTVYYIATGYCGSDTATKVVTIQPVPTAKPITGPDSLCVGASATLADSVVGGTWSAFNHTATISGAVVTGSAGGIDTVQYAYSNTCGSFMVKKTITVIALPMVSAITGPATFCIATPATFTDSAAGGTWTASWGLSLAGSVAMASVAGTDTLTYTLTNVCGTASASMAVTVDSPRFATLAGRSYVCIGNEDTVQVQPPGGTLTLSNGNADWASDKVAKGVEPGLDTVTYRYTNACGTSAASVVIQVYGKGSCDSLNGVQEIGLHSGALIINPNPSTGLYNMSLSTPGHHIAIRMTDLLGNSLLETAYEDTNNWSIDIHGQASGVYMVTVIVDGVSYFGKLVLW